MRKKIFRILAVTMGCILAAGAVLTGIGMVGNDYCFRQINVTIPGAHGDLEGVLTLPESKEQARGLVVMIHGDGPVDATMGGLYNSWFEGAAEAGFATLSWSKPGVGKSAGDWLALTMEERANETSAVIDWAHVQSYIPTQTIVLWGASQAGWVLPKVTRYRSDIDGVVAVGTAINWLRQGRFNLEAELEYEGMSAQERQQRFSNSNAILLLLQRGASYEEYLSAGVDAEPMTHERWGFIQKNFEADATADLVSSAQLPIRWHLMLGEYDRNVDVFETEKTYRSILKTSLTVTHFDGTHSLAKPIMEDNSLWGFITGTVWPRALLAPGVIDAYRQFLATVV